jgi:hypothetical protein
MVPHHIFIYQNCPKIFYFFNKIVKNLLFFHQQFSFSEHVFTSICRAVRDAVMSPEFLGKIDAFITLHAYSQLWIYPYSHKKFSYPNDVEDLVGKLGIEQNFYGL